MHHTKSGQMQPLGSDSLEISEVKNHGARRAAEEIPQSLMPRETTTTQHQS
jgi:hypothetical protein